MLTLYDADRCPYCARARIVLAEKGVEHEVVAVDLTDRPRWMYEKNETGRVPVLEEDAWLLPESSVIMEYLEELHFSEQDLGFLAFTLPQGEILMPTKKPCGEE